MFIGSTLFCFLLLVGLFTFVNMQGFPEEELIRRCEASHPTWNDYQEQIKAIHAPSVAIWEGELVYAVLNEDLELHFRLKGFWAESKAAIPVLVRLPDGREHEMITLREAASSEIRYVYRPEKAFTTTYPWIEIHYPHTQQRINFDSGGEWQKKSTSIE